MAETGMIFDIQRLSLHNGDGLRTSIFLKGCPLQCKWCHNPESQKFQTEILFKWEKCIACGLCVSICPQNGHSIRNGFHTFDRTLCQSCLQCTQNCPTGSLERIGKEMTVDEVMAIILRDKVFYDTSGGGVTISGGEPLAQAPFTLALARACKEAGIHVCIDTSGFGSTTSIARLADVTDTFLFDIKETDPVLHKEWTGVSNELIIENLRLLDKMDKNLYLRCPIIPGCNDREDHLKGIASLANSLLHAHEIHIIPYHPLGIQKSSWLNQVPSLSSQEFPQKEDVAQWIQMIAKQTHCPVKEI